MIARYKNSLQVENLFFETIENLIFSLFEEIFQNENQFRDLQGQSYRKPFACRGVFIRQISPV